MFPYDDQILAAVDAAPQSVDEVIGASARTRLPGDCRSPVKIQGVPALQLSVSMAVSTPVVGRTT